MPVGVPGTITGLALGHPRATDRAIAVAITNSPVASPTGIAKQPTRFLGYGADATACATDQSQRATNLTASGGYLFEASPASARFDIAYRTMGFRLMVNDSDTGVLYRHGAASPDRLEFSAASTLRVTVNNSVVQTYSVVGLIASRQQVVVAWATQPNPDGTGAGDAALSTLMVWVGTTFDQVSFTHAASSTKTQTIILGGSTHPAGTPFSGVVNAIWFENGRNDLRASATEIAADWVADVAAVTSSAHAVTDLQGLPPEQGVIDGESSWQGPAHVWCADATRRMERRTLQWLVNERLRIVPAWTATTLTATDDFIRGAPGDSADRMSIAWLHVAPVPDNCNRIWARVHLRSYVSSGAAVPVRVRLYSFSKPPGSLGLLGGGGGSDPMVSYFCGLTVLEGYAAGRYAVLGSCPIARGSSGIRFGKTYLALAIAVDPLGESANDSAARVEIGAIHVVPYYREGGQGLPVHP